MSRIKEAFHEEIFNGMNEPTKSKVDEVDSDPKKGCVTSNKLNITKVTSKN